MLYYCNESNINSIYKSSKQINLNYTKPAISWPSFGEIIISKLQLSYQQQSNMFVLDIDQKIEIKSGSKIAICGRTGSGKSSILFSIFRLFEPSINSNVIIDDLDIYKLGLFI